MRIDSHQHFWEYTAAEYDWIPEDTIRKDFGPAELEPLIDEAGIDGVIAVQARTHPKENDFLLAHAGRHDWIRGVVGYADLCATDAGKTLETLAAHHKLCGVREVLQGMEDDAYCLREDFNRGVARLVPLDLTYDILVFHRHLANVLKFVDRHPDQIFVLDHIAKPEIASPSPDKSWVKNMRELGRRENVFCKFSGVVTKVSGGAVRDRSLFHPYFETVLESFGCRRVMFGSDWPVCLLEAGYQEWVDVVEQLASPLSSDEQRFIWGRAALDAYRLECTAR